MKKRESIIPIDNDWTDEMVKEISSYLFKNRQKIDEFTSINMAIQVVALVQKHLDKNDYKLT